MVITGLTRNQLSLFGSVGSNPTHSAISLLADSRQQAFPFIYGLY